jgi:hypothetical protein
VIAFADKTPRRPASLTQKKEKVLAFTSDARQKKRAACGKEGTPRLFKRRLVYGNDGKSSCSDTDDDSDDEYASDDEDDDANKQANAFLPSSMERMPPFGSPILKVDLPGVDLLLGEERGERILLCQPCAVSPATTTTTDDLPPPMCKSPYLVQQEHDLLSSRIAVLEAELKQKNEQVLRLRRNENTALKRSRYHASRHDDAQYAYNKAKNDAMQLQTRCTFEATPGGAADAFMAALNCCNLQKKKESWINRKANEVASKILDADDAGMSVLQQKVKAAIRQKCKKQERDECFTPFNLLRAMDFHGATLSQAGIEVVRTVETKNEKYVAGSTIPSSSSLRRVANMIENYASHTGLAFHHGVEEGRGEYISFDPIDVIGQAIMACGLGELARHEFVLLVDSIDGAMLTRHFGHVCYGIKIIDRRSSNPFNRKKGGGVQSRDHVFPICILIGKETRETMTQFFPMYFKATQDAVLKGVYEKYGFKVELAHNADLSAQWKFLGKGGAYKRDTYPCHCCAIKNDSLLVPNEGSCRICTTINHRAEDPDFLCYHKEMLTEEKVGELKRRGVDLSAQLTDEDGIERFRTHRLGSKLNMNENPLTVTDQEKNNVSSIHFDISGPASQEYTAEAELERSRRHTYARYIGNDLAIRGLDFSTGSLLERQKRLRKVLITEWQYIYVLDQIRHGELSANTAAHFHLINTIPCILHAENRMGLKLMTTLFRTGLSNVIAKKLHGDEASEEKRINQWLDNIETIINQQIIGTLTEPMQWRVPYNKEDKAVCVVTFENHRVRKVLENFNLLIDACVVVEDDIRNWKKATIHYNKAITWLRSHEDLSDSDIFTFQKEADLFFQLWVRMTGRSGQTNYFHMFGSGHFAEYLFYWRNLYQHSQQGWEAFNALLKNYFFKRTNRGGGKAHTRLKAIGRWLQRRIVLMNGVELSTIREHHNSTL